MRFLFVATGNGRNPAIGGSLRRTIEIAREARRHGHEIHFLVTRGSRLACEALDLKPSFHEVPSYLLRPDERGLADRIGSYVMSTLAAIERISEFSAFDAVYSDSDYLCDTIPSGEIARRHGSRWVAMIHHILRGGHAEDYGPIRPIARLGQSLSFGRICSFASAVMVYDTPEGDSIAEHLQGRYRFGGPIFRVKNGIRLDALPRAGGDENPLYDACFIGGLRPSKGIFDLAEIWARVIELIPGARLAIVGGGLKGYENALRRRLAVRGIARSIHLLGALDNESALAILARSRVLVSPSHEEGWGIGILEALAVGVPVVAYDLPAYSRTFRDVIQVVEPPDVDAFARRIVQLLDEECEPRRQRIAAGRQRAELYAWEQVAQQDLSNLKSLIEPA